MISAETTQKWFDDIHADARLTGWIAEAEKAYELRMGPYQGSEWISRVKDGKADIGMAETNRPLPSFAHEILHVCMSARGYRHILGSINFDPQKNKVVGALLSALDNELQHHRMFQEFVAAGFDGGEFYADNDDDGHGEVRKQIQALTARSHPANALFAYLPLLAPGGRWPEGEREDLTALLEQTVSAVTWVKLQKIEGFVESWKDQPHFDPTNTIISVLETLGGFDDTFVGEDVEKYPDGSFVPRFPINAEFNERILAALASQHGKQ